MSSNNSLPYNISEYALCDVLPVVNVTFLSGEDKCRWYASEGGGNPWRVSCRSGETETGVKGPFCTCNLYYGYHSGPNCDWTDKYLTPECFVPSPLNNFDPCRLNSTGYPLIFTISSMVVVALATLLFFYQMYILRTIAKKKFTGFDSKWSTLIMSTVANFWFILWAAGGASPALTGDMFYERMVMRPIAIPMASFCMLTAGLNIVLMWVQVYRDSQNMKRAKQNLDNRSFIFVIITCFLCFITLFVCFVILNSSALGSGATLVYLVLLIVVYSYGANKIKGMLKSSKSSRLQLIVGTSNKLILGFCNHIVLAGIIAVIPDAHKTNLFSIIFAICLNLVYYNWLFMSVVVVQYLAGMILPQKKVSPDSFKQNTTAVSKTGGKTSSAGNNTSNVTSTGGSSVTSTGGSSVTSTGGSSVASEVTSEVA